MELRMDAITAAGIARAEEARAPWTSAQWREYFRVNAISLMTIPWEVGVTLTAEQRAAIAESVPQFQLGESSDGVHFISVAREHAARTGDAGYVAALRRFIAEEQRHGRDLARVLDLAEIPKISHCWADSIFRWIRKRGGLDLSISVLVTAEFIAQVYYIALRDATESPVIRRLCQQILRDEDEHVRFQCERLAILRREHRAWRVVLKQLMQRGFFAGTCLVFWWKHAALMRAGGFGFFSFRRVALQKFRIARRLMDPRRYLFDAEPVAKVERKARALDVVRENSSRLGGEASGKLPTPDIDLGGKWLEL